MKTQSYTLQLHQLPSMIENINLNLKHSILLLQGDVASGKTTLVKQWAKSLGIQDGVSSPTFSFCQVYEKNIQKFSKNVDKISIFHYDLYLKSFLEVLNLGLLEELEKDGLHFVEWGETDLSKMLVEVGIPHWIINITPISNLKRRYCVIQTHSTKHL